MKLLSSYLVCVIIFLAIVTLWMYTSNFGRCWWISAFHFIKWTKNKNHNFVKPFSKKFDDYTVFGKPQYQTKFVHVWKCIHIIKYIWINRLISVKSLTYTHAYRIKTFFSCRTNVQKCKKNVQSKENIVIYDKKKAKQVQATLTSRLGFEQISLQNFPCLGLVYQRYFFWMFFF